MTQHSQANPYGAPAMVGGIEKYEREIVECLRWSGWGQDGQPKPETVLAEYKALLAERDGICGATELGLSVGAPLGPCVLPAGHGGWHEGAATDGLPPRWSMGTRCETHAALVESMCHWKQRRGNARDESHWNFHYGSPCPYEAVAAVLCGEPDPRHEVHTEDVWRSSGGRRIGRKPDKITRHACGCVTGWDDAFEECVLTRCQGHGASLLQPREQPPASVAESSSGSS